MKVTISPEAAQAIKEICGKLKAGNEMIGKSASAVLSKMAIAYNANATTQELNQLAESLLSPEAKRTAILKRLAHLANGLDAETALKLLEKSVRKLDSSTSVKIEKDWEN
jgi:hypothetical protein